MSNTARAAAGPGGARSAAPSAQGFSYWDGNPRHVTPTLATPQPRVAAVAADSVAAAATPLCRAPEGAGAPGAAATHNVAAAAEPYKSPARRMTDQYRPLSSPPRPSCNNLDTARPPSPHAAAMLRSSPPRPLPWTASESGTETTFEASRSAINHTVGAFATRRRCARERARAHARAKNGPFIKPGAAQLAVERAACCCCRSCADKKEFLGVRRLGGGASTRAVSLASHPGHPLTTTPAAPPAPWTQPWVCGGRCWPRCRTARSPRRTTGKTRKRKLKATNQAGRAIRSS